MTRRRLDAWKEIARYLGRDVTTVRRWEKREGLPVHRHRHEKLGSVEIDAGSRVNESTADINVPLVDYGRAMTKLANAGLAQGANAVVLRSHQGVYFTRNGKQSRKPVYVKLRGAAIRLAEPGQCQLVFVDVEELEARSRSGKPVEVSSREAFEGE